MSWNARVKCVKAMSRDLTLGKIYVVKDGFFIDDDGCVFGKYEEYTDINNLNKRFDSKFELVEEDGVDKEIATYINIEGKPHYWDNICKMQQKQTEKGLSKYRQVLEDNTKMNVKTRLEYLQEELIDGLMYIEHIKAILGIIYQKKVGVHNKKRIYQN